LIINIRILFFLLLLHVDGGSPSGTIWAESWVKLDLIDFVLDAGLDCLPPGDASELDFFPIVSSFVSFFLEQSDFGNNKWAFRKTTKDSKASEPRKSEKKHWSLGVSVG
jgi:hypothetical protein